MTTPVLMTAEELLTYPEMDKRVELVRGRLIVRETPGMRHGECELRIAVALSNFLTADRAARSATQTLGRVMVADPASHWRATPTPYAHPISPMSRARDSMGRCRTDLGNVLLISQWKYGRRLIGLAGVG